MAPPKKVTKKPVEEETDDLVDFEPDNEDIQDSKNSKTGQQ
jgi:hypothetical protein